MPALAKAACRAPKRSVFQHRDQAAPHGEAGAVERVHEFRLAAACGAEPGVHPPRLEIAAGRDRGDLAIGVLPRQPDLDVMGAPRAEAHVAGAQHDRAIGQAQRSRMPSAQRGHAVELGVGVIGMGDRHHLDLLELVLAQHARGVAARRAGLGAEALGMGGIRRGR
jgi:hypothetical protein